jgi:acyl-CoA synthetase (NDP forming)
MYDKRAFDAIFAPRSICVVGASSSSVKTGSFAMRSALASNVPVYPVNRSGVEEILGQKAYKTIEDIPDNDIDLFFLVVPPKAVIPALQSAIKKGCKAAIIHGSGYKESGEEGARIQDEIQRIADEAGIRIIGPNTIGYLRAASNLNATFEPQYSDLFKEKGKITLLMQSGGIGVLSLSEMMEQGIPLGTMIALGNRLNTDLHDMLNFFAEDPETDVICMHVEGTDNLRELYEAAERCVRKKPVLVVVGGTTDGGRKGAQSHTGTMASSANIYSAAFKQAGVIQVNSVNEMINAAKMLSVAPPPKGDKICVLTHMAGPSILCCDNLIQEGLKLSDISDNTKKRLLDENVVPAEFINPQNPVDLTAYGKEQPERFTNALRILAEDKDVDGVIGVSASALADEYAPQFLIEEFGAIAKEYSLPLAMVWCAYYSDYHHEYKRFLDAGICAYPNPNEAAAAFANFVKYYKVRDKDKGEYPKLNFDPALNEYLDSCKGRENGFLLEHESKQVMEYAGIKTASGELVNDAKSAVEEALKIGFPVVLKVAADNIVHKSDMGGVKLNLSSESEVEDAFNDIKEKALAIPNSGFRGVLVQPMLPPGGTELIVGAMQDPQAGPVIMVGLGGIYVEILKDVSFRLAPVTKMEAKEMLNELKGAAILKGVRGSEAIDESTLADIIVRVSELISTQPIEEIDLNPVICYGGSKYYAADARVIMSE